MTTIAWDGVIVASDSRMVTGDYCCPGEKKKIKRVGEWLYAISGYGAWFDAWISWHQDGCDPRNTPPCVIPEGSTGNFLAFKNGECWHCTKGLPYMQELKAPDAWGSGYQYAIGAMLAGANAARAVEIAIMADINSGGPVHAFADLCVPPLHEETQ